MFLGKINSFFMNCIYGIFGLLFLLILCILIFIDKSVEYYHSNAVEMTNLSLLVGVIVFIASYIFYVSRFQFKDRFQIKKVFLILSAVLFILQLFLVLNIAFRAGWDVGVINRNSNILVADLDLNFSMNYFQRYSNNVFMLFIYTIFKRMGLFLSLPGFGLLILMGILLTNITVLLTSLIAYRLTDNKQITMLTYVIAALLFGLSPWITVPYSDVYSVLFPVLTLFVYVYLKDSRHSDLRWFLVFLIPILGYLIKPQNVIILIAIIITELLNLKKYKISVRNIAVLLLIVGVSFGSMQSLKLVSIRSTGVYPNDELRYPMIHWAMMGLNERTNGVFAREDPEFTSSFPGIEAKKEQNMLEIKHRLSKMGKTGFMKHMTRKTLTNYNDGTFAWGKEGNFYAHLFREPIPVVSSFMRSLYYNEGSLHRYFATFQQWIWMMVLVLGFISCLIKSKLVDKKVELNVLLSIIGVTLFSTIFEARARYLFLYAPFYVLCAMIGLYKLQHKINRRFFNKGGF